MANRQVTLDVSDNIIAAAVMAQSFWSIKNLRLIEPHAAGDNTRVVVNPNANYIPIDIGAHWFLMDSAVDVDSVDDLDTGALAAGTDYYVYACTDGTSLSFKISANATNPTGFDAAHSRKIGGFHTLCTAVNHGGAGHTLAHWVADHIMAVGESVVAVAPDGYIYRVIAIAGDFKTHAATEPNWAGIAVNATIVDDQVTWKKEQHALEGFAAKDILPASVWCLKHRSRTLVNVGLYFNSGSQKWAYIYLQSGTGTGTTSVFGGTITDTRTWMDHVDDGNAVGMRFPRDGEFQSIAAGSNEETNIVGSGDPGTTGGHLDTAGRRMVSNEGAEDCCGAMYQWLLDEAYIYSGTTGYWGNLPGAKGSGYTNFAADPGAPEMDNADVGSDTKLSAGGAWDYAAIAGSRCRVAYFYRWYALTHVGARFVSEPL